MGGSDYDVFVSYARSVSTPLAVALQRELERFAKKWNQVRALRVFRDDSSMSASPSLWSSIEAALTTSKYFILIATPESAASEYVDQEARWWVTHKGADSILVVLAGGKLDWSDAAGGFTPDSSVPPALQRAFAEEPRWIDMTWFDDPDSAGNADPRFQERVADLAAPVRGVDRDALIGANLKEHRKTMRRARIAIAALSTLLVAALVAGSVAVTRGNTAKRLFADSVGQRIAPEAARILNGEIPGGLGRGLQETLVAQQLKITPDPVGYFRALIRTTEIEKIATTALQSRIAVSRNVIATGSPTHADEIQILDTDFSPAGPAIPAGNGLYPVAISHDQNLLALGNDDGLVELWDLETRIRKGSIRTTPTRGTGFSYVEKIVFTPDGKGFVVRTGDNTIRFYAVETMQQTAPEIQNTAWFTAPKDGHIIAVAPLHGRSVEIRDPRNGNLIGEPLPASSADLFFTDCGSFDEAGDRLLIQDEIHDLKTRAVVGKVSQVTCSASVDATLSPDGTMVMVGGDSVRVFEPMNPDSDPKGAPVLPSGGPFEVLWLDNQRGFAAGPSGMLTFDVDRFFWQAATNIAFGAAAADFAVQQPKGVTGYRGKTALPALPGCAASENRLTDSGGPCTLLAGAPRGDSFVTFAVESGTLDEWSFEDGRHIRAWPLLLDGDTYVKSVIDDPSHQSFAVHTSLERGAHQGGGTIRRWDVATGRQLGKAFQVPTDIAIEDLLDFSGGRVTALTTKAQTGHSRSSIWSFDLDTGTSNSQHTFDEPVMAAALCRDPEGVNAWMFVLETGKVGFARGTLEQGIPWTRPPVVAHKNLGNARVALSGDCRTAASMGIGAGKLISMLQFWNVDNGDPLGSPIEGGTVIGWGNGRIGLVTLEMDTLGMGFRIIPERPTAVDLCAKLVSNMSRKEWDAWISPDLEYQKACPELPIAPDE